jgi:hypothetical protein
LKEGTQEILKEERAGVNSRPLAAPVPALRCTTDQELASAKFEARDLVLDTQAARLNTFASPLFTNPEFVRELGDRGPLQVREVQSDRKHFSLSPKFRSHLSPITPVNPRAIDIRLLLIKAEIPNRSAQVFVSSSAVSVTTTSGVERHARNFPQGCHLFQSRFACFVEDHDDSVRGRAIR